MANTIGDDSQWLAARIVLDAVRQSQHSTALANE